MISFYLHQSNTPSSVYEGTIGHLLPSFRISPAPPEWFLKTFPTPKSLRWIPTLVFHKRESSFIWESLRPFLRMIKSDFFSFPSIFRVLFPFLTPPHLRNPAQSQHKSVRLQLGFPRYGNRNPPSRKFILQTRGGGGIFLQAFYCLGQRFFGGNCDDFSPVSPLC